jgi:hypothetical protein
MLLAVGDLVLLGGAVVACCVHPTRIAAWLLVICSALWLPLNNGHLEGPVLITANPTHGLTAADLIGYGGWAVAALTLHRVRHRSPAGLRWLPITAAAVVLVCGITVSYFVQPAQNDQRFHRDHWRGQLYDQPRQ